MKELFAKALLAYVEMLEIHLDCKTTDKNLHEWTNDFYELLFDIAHSIWERFVDNWGWLRSDHNDCSSQGNASLQLLSTLKSEIETIIESKWLSIWEDNLLRWYVDKLEFSIGNAKALIKNKMMSEKTTEEVIVVTPKDDTLTDEVEAELDM